MDDAEAEMLEVAGELRGALFDLEELLDDMIEESEDG